MARIYDPDTHRLPAVTEQGYVHWFPVYADPRPADGWRYVLGGAMCGAHPRDVYRQGTFGWWGSKRRITCKRCQKAIQRTPLPLAYDRNAPAPPSGDAPTLSPR